MSRRAIAGFACFVVFVALISAARADHDPTAPFAGAWGLGPRGEQGQLVLSRVDDAAGRALLAQLGGALPCSEPADFYRGRLATAADGGPVAGCASRRAAARLDGVYMDEALASLGPPAGLQVQIRRGEGPRATLRWTSPAEAGVVRHAPLVFLGHVAGDGADPVVTLRRLRIAVAHRPGDATATIVGTFRGRATPGRSRYRLLPVGVAVATYRPRGAPAQRARVEEAIIDARSGAGYLRVVGIGTLIGGPVATGAGGACRHVAFRYTVRQASGIAVLRWACRARSGRTPPLLLDVFRRPRDRIASSYTIIRRPCSPRTAQAGEPTLPSC